MLFNLLVKAQHFAIPLSVIVSEAKSFSCRFLQLIIKPGKSRKGEKPTSEKRRRDRRHYEIKTHENPVKGRIVACIRSNEMTAMFVREVRGNQAKRKSIITFSSRLNSFFTISHSYAKNRN